MKALLIVITMLVPSGAVAPSVSDDPTPARLLKLFNDHRNKKGLEPLTLDSTLTKVAQAKAEDMARREYMGHKDPDGQKVWPSVKRAGYDYEYVAENLAVAFHDSDELMAGWTGSPAHNAHILDSRYRDVGFGFAKGSYEGRDEMYAVALFGSRK